MFSYFYLKTFSGHQPGPILLVNGDNGKGRTIEMLSEAAMTHQWKGAAPSLLPESRRFCARASHHSTVGLWGHIILRCEGGPEHCSVISRLQGLHQLNDSTNLLTDCHLAFNTQKYLQLLANMQNHLVEATAV